VSDKGVVCICDPRIVGKDYGGLFVNSLPDMKRTRDQEVVVNFLEEYLNSVDDSDTVIRDQPKNDQSTSEEATPAKSKISQ
jgi:hypothetical protein